MNYRWEERWVKGGGMRMEMEIDDVQMEKDAENWFTDGGGEFGDR